MSKTVAILIFPGVQSLDVTGPMDVFCEANRFLAPEDHYHLEVIGFGHGTMAASNGLSLQAHKHYSEALQPYDLLLVAGGPLLPFEDFGPQFDDWLRAAAAKAKRFGSICNGAFMLARAGLLDGKTVTTHWGDAADLARRCPSAKVEADRLYMQSVRNFSRVFAREARITPADFVERARVDAARVMLESSHAPLKTVAYQCGFRDAQHMRSVFNRRLGVTPQQFRLNFAAPV